MKMFRVQRRVPLVNVQAYAQHAPPPPLLPPPPPAPEPPLPPKRRVSIYDPTVTRGVAARRIISWCEKRYGLPAGSICSRCRRPVVCRARTLAIGVLVHHPKTRALSIAAIGRMLGRNHATILYAMKKMPASQRYAATRKLGNPYISVDQFRAILDLRFQGHSWPRAVAMSGVDISSNHAAKLALGSGTPSMRPIARDALAQMGITPEEGARKLQNIKEMIRARSARARVLKSWETRSLRSSGAECVA